MFDAHSEKEEFPITKVDIKSVLTMVDEKPLSFKGKIQRKILKVIASLNFSEDVFLLTVLLNAVLTIIGYLFFIPEEVKLSLFDSKIFGFLAIAFMSFFTYVFLIALPLVITEKFDSKMKKEKESLILNLFDLSENEKDVEKMIVNMQKLEDFLILNYKMYSPLSGCLSEYIKFYGKTPNLLSVYLKKINSLHNLSEIDKADEMKSVILSKSSKKDISVEDLLKEV